MTATKKIQNMQAEIVKWKQSVDKKDRQHDNNNYL